MDSIGEILRQEREKRGLSLQEIHDATKITVQSIADLEEDKFEGFANKVYARAFLRDYANFLNLNSAALLTAYEEKWSPGVDREPAPVKKGGLGRRVFGYALVVVIIAGALGAVGYYGWLTVYKQRGAVGDLAVVANHTQRPDVATIPKAQPITPPKPEAAPETNVASKPPPPAAFQKAVLEVSALLPVWIRVETDGRQAFMGILAKGQTQTYEGRKSVFIRAGMAGAVQIKFNGQTQPPLGSLKTPGQKSFTLPATPAAAAEPAQGPSAGPTPATPPR